MLRGVGWGRGVSACRRVGRWEGPRWLRGAEGAEGVVPWVPPSDYPARPRPLRSYPGRGGAGPEETAAGSNAA